VAETAPKIDLRDVDAILREAREMAPVYTPEWVAGEDAGAGAALLKVFAKLLEGVIRRLNEVPLKNFVAFLEMIGIRLLPALPARVPLTFLLSAGAKEAVVIPARSQAAGTPTTGGDPVVFETERTILATPARMQAVFAVVPARDEIYNYTDELASGATAELFAATGKNLQQHSLFIGHNSLFNIKGHADIKLTIYEFDAALTRTETVAWQYCAGEKQETINGEPSQVPDWRDFDDIKVVPQQQNLPREEIAETLILSKRNTDEIKKAKINGVESYWIRCLIKKPLAATDALARLIFKEFTVAVSPLSVGAAVDTQARGDGARVETKSRTAIASSVTQPSPEDISNRGIEPDKAFYNDLPLKLPATGDHPLTPFGPPPRAGDVGVRPRQGDIFYLASEEALSKKGAQVSLIVNTSPSSQASTRFGLLATDIERVQGLGKTFAARLRAAGINTTADLLGLSAEEGAEIIRNRQKDVPAERYVTKMVNIQEAATKEFYDKTGTPPNLFRTSLVAGDEADENNTPPQTTPILSWEYWNGKGWVGLADVIDDTNALTTTGVVLFTCPADLAPTRVIGQENYWIRVRIAFGDYGKEEISVVPNSSPPTVAVNTSKILPPVLYALQISYSVPGEAPTFVQTLSNLQYATQTTTPFAPFSALDDEAQTLYMGFDRAPVKGPLSIFFSLEEQEYTEENLPRVEWEYFRRRDANDAGEWARLVVTDGTRNLTESGTIEFIGPADFAPLARFGQTLYWIRAIDTEGKFKPLRAVANEFAEKNSASRQTVEDAATARRKRLVRQSLITLLGDRVSSPVGEAFRRRIPERASLAVEAVARKSSQENVAAPSSADVETKACGQSVESLELQFSVDSGLTEGVLAPLVRGIYLNTAWASQSETIGDEILGSSSGVADQSFTLTKFPVIEEAIWVDELGSLTESERKAFVAGGAVEVDERRDDEGNTTEFRTRWTRTDDLAAATATSRVYAIDRTYGQVVFGDGVHGMVPPIGRDNIRASYQAGGGASGNIDASLINALRTTIPFVDRVTNPIAASGGSDTELLEKALERGTRSIKNRGRAVTAEDFEQIALEASQSVARVKALPTFNDEGRYETNWVTVIVVPSSEDARPMPSPQLRLRVEKYLQERSANVAAFARHIKVTSPAYVEVRLSADIFPLTIDLAPDVEADAVRIVKGFLHPLTGGYEGGGWEFGRLPCLSDFYALLEAVEGVDHVENLTMRLQAVTPAGKLSGEPTIVTEERPLSIEAPQYTLVFSGEHKFTVKPLE
jgi:hypothetical protein